MKNIALFVVLLFFTSTLFAQETVERTHKIDLNITEKLHLLKSDKSTRHGLYQATYGKFAIASGQFDHDVKTGVWHFYDQHGRLLQNYDYTKKELLFEAPEDTTSNIRYFVDKVLTDSDRTTKPVKAGGRYYGYLPYLKLFKLPPYLMDISRTASVAAIELLVSPGGRLAYCKVNIISGNYEKAFNIKVDAFQEEDKTFIPATVNGEPIGCRIIVRAFIDDDGTLTF